MAWYALYETGTGRLVSVTTILPSPLPARLGIVTRQLRPRESEMWDEASRDWVARPPKVLRDRLRDLRESDTFADFRTLWQSLSTARRAVLRDALIRLLGRARWRADAEPEVIEP